MEVGTAFAEAFSVTTETVFSRKKKAVLTIALTLLVIYIAIP